MINNLDYDVLFVKEMDTEMKPYYAPIIPAYINAVGRTRMWEELSKLPEEDRLYIDTDSIYFRGDHLKDYYVGGYLGIFKSEGEKQKIMIYGRKSKAFGDKITMAGFNLKNITYEEFVEGKIKTKRMKTLKTSLGGDIS